MAYDAALADRVRDVLEGLEGVDRDAVVEKRMFGGLAFVVADYMAVAVSNTGGLLLRVDPAEAEQLRQEPHVEEFVMRERPMRGWLRVRAEGCTALADLRRWVGRGVERAHQLPARQPAADDVRSAGG